MRSDPLVIIQTGDAAPEIVAAHGNFESMFIRLGGVDSAKTAVVYAARGEKPDSPERYSGAIVAGSPFMVTDRLPWSEELALWLVRAVEDGLPLLAVCYGHQLLAHALGGVVGPNPSGTEAGTRTIRLRSDAARHPLLANLPATFPANVSHSQCVLRIPACGQIAAEADHDPHHAIRYGDKALGVQFHPEFDRATMRAFIDLDVRDRLISPDRADVLNKTAADTPESLRILRDFICSISASST